jgi:ketosteroid isomerase-like protein
MEIHPSEKLLKELYALFARGDIESVIAMCDESMVYKVPGSIPTSGTYSNHTFGKLVDMTMQMSNGTFRESPVDIIANDNHGVVLLIHSLERNGKRIEYRTSHRWTICNGKFVAWEEYPGSEEEFNKAWS